MAKSNRKFRQNSGCTLNQMGGNLGNGYTIGGPVSAAAPGDALRVTYSSCDAGTRPGLLSGVAHTGLPGVSPRLFGGKRRSRSRSTRRRSTRRKGSRKARSRFAYRKGSRKAYQRGAGYGFSAPVSTDLGTQGGLAGIQRTPCELGVGEYRSPTISTLSADAMKMSGGSAPFPMALEVPTAGYTQGPSPWVGSTGAPVELAIPVAGRAGPSAACMQTGGKRRRSRNRKAHRSAKRTHRSTKRKGSRKSRRTH